MSSREINLLGERHVISAAEIKLRQSVKFWTPVFLGIYIFIAVSVGIFYFYLSGNIQKIKRNTDTEKSKVAALERNEGVYLLLKQKSAALTKIFANRYPYLYYFKFFKSLETPGVVINSLTLRDTGDLELIVDVGNTDLLDDFLEVLLSEGGKKFTEIRLISVQLNNGAYKIDLSLNSELNEISNSTAL